jgi:hypothetical protein
MNAYDVFLGCSLFSMVVMLFWSMYNIHSILKERRKW